jgi:uridine kinase
MIVNEIVDRIKNINCKQNPLIIAIEGFGGSGKSTLAKVLSETLNDSYVISMDDFIIKEQAENPVKADFFDRVRLVNQVLKPLRRNENAFYQKLQWSENKLSEEIRVPAVRYLIIEGISSFHPEIIGYVDYKIWIETNATTARSRGRQRDKLAGNDNDHLWDGWTNSYHDYIKLYQPELLADYKFCNS